MTGQGRFIAVWIALVVGVHFWPMAALLPGTLLIPLVAVLVIVAAAELVVGTKGNLMPIAITGAICGCALLLGAV